MATYRKEDKRLSAQALAIHNKWLMDNGYKAQAASKWGGPRPQAPSRGATNCRRDKVSC